MSLMTEKQRLHVSIWPEFDGIGQRIHGDGVAYEGSVQCRFTPSHAKPYLE